MQRSLYFILFLASFLISCNSTPPKYYKLALEKTEIAPSSDGKIYALRNVNFPEYFDSQYLIYFENCCQINRNNKRLWQDEIKDNVRRYLHHRLGGYIYPLPQNLKPQIIRDITITELIAYKEKGYFYAKASWQITDIENDKTKSGNFEKSYPLDFKKEGLEERLVKLYKLALNEIAAAIKN